MEQSKLINPRVLYNRHPEPTKARNSSPGTGMTSEVQMIRKKPPLPVGSTSYNQRQRQTGGIEMEGAPTQPVCAYCQNHVVPLSNASIHSEASNKSPVPVPRDALSSSGATASPEHVVRARTAAFQKRLPNKSQIVYRKGSLNTDMPPRPRKYSSPPSILLSRSGECSSPPVPSKRKSVATPLPPLPPRVPITSLNTSSKNISAMPLQRPLVPPKPVELRDHLSKSESELRYLSEIHCKESRSRHNSFNFPTPLPPVEMITRQPFPAKRRSTISLDERSIFDQEFDMSEDIPPGRRGTTGAESILRARYEEKKTGCCREWSKDCIVDLPECIMDIFC